MKTLAIRISLYAGTENGLYASWNGGDRWVSIRNEMPAVPVRDLLVHPRDNDLIVGTHGRGAYILDDLAPLQRLAEATAADVFLFEPRAATRWVVAGRDGDLGQRQWVGQNPPQGALISFYLKTEAKDSVRLTISDAGGRAIRELRNVPRDSGVNRVTWDLRYEGPRQPADTSTQRRPGERGGRGRRTLRVQRRAVRPSRRIHSDAPRRGKTLTTKIQVRSDPRVTVTVADLKAQHDAALAVRDLVSRVNLMLEQTDGVARQLGSLNQTLRSGARGPGCGTASVATVPGLCSKARRARRSRP